MEKKKDLRKENKILKNGKDKMTEDSLRITDKWKLPLTQMQLDELDKMVDFYSRIYKQEKPEPNWSCIRGL